MVVPARPTIPAADSSSSAGVGGRGQRKAPSRAVGAQPKGGSGLRFELQQHARVGAWPSPELKRIHEKIMELTAQASRVRRFLKPSFQTLTFTSAP